MMFKAQTNIKYRMNDLPPYSYKLHLEDVSYIGKMVFITATFPISLPLLFLLEFSIEDVKDSTTYPPWKKRKFLHEKLQEEINAKKKTYNYIYSQKTVSDNI